MKAVNAGAAAAAVGLAIFLDAAVETFRAGSPVRWWVGGAVLLYLIATAATWRSTIGWRGRLAIAGIGLSALVAVTAWGPTGLSDGVRLAGQPTARVLASLAALGVVLAGFTVIRLGIAPPPIRIAVALIAAYGAAAFVLGAVSGTPFAAMLGGQSVWQRLPAFLQGAFVGGLIVLPLGLVAAVVAAGLRRPAAASLRADVWKVAAIASSLAIVLAGMPWRSSSAGSTRAAAAPAPIAPQTLAARLGIDPGSPRLSPAALDAALANSLKAIEDGERDTPRDRWDPAYVATALGSDPQRIFAWVQANTFWIPYRGLLRGSIGVLMDRLGNTLDRSVLLAILLRQSGNRVRLARGSLTTEQALAVMPSLVAARYAAAARPSPEAPNQIAAIAAQYHLDEISVRRTIDAQTDFGSRKQTLATSRAPKQAQQLAAAVGSRPPEPIGAAFDRAIEALRDHWWVQVDRSGTWEDFDLLSPSAGAAIGNADRTIELDGFPDELRHQVTLRVIAEQWANGRLSEHLALEKVLRPTQLVGTPITLRFMPPKFPANFPPPNMSPAQGLRAVALDQHEWMPTLVVGKESTTQSAIRDTGELMSAAEAREASGGMAGGAMRGLTKRLDDAFGPPVSEPKPSASTTLASTWIEYEIQQPGERPQKIRRVVFDLIGPAARVRGTVTAPRLDETATLTRNLALMRETEILPIVCRFTPEYVTHLAARSLLENREILTSLVRGDVPDDFARARDIANRLAPGPSELYGLALARFDWSRLSNGIFIDNLNLLTRHTFFVPSANRFRLLQVTDIIANDIGVDFTADAFAVRLEQGVLDTNAEAVLASDRPDASNPGWVYGESGSWLTLRSPDDPQLRTLGLSEDVRHRIAGDLAAGYLVVAPKAPVPIGNDAFSGWWRVHPATGQALGMGSTGMGQEMVEYLIVIAWGFGLGFLFAYMWCRMVSGGEAPVARGCEPAPQRRVPFLDFFVRPVYAIGSQCLQDALIAGLLGGLLGAAGKWGGSKPGGGGGKPNPSEPPPANPEPGSPGGGGPSRGGGPGGRGGGPSPGKNGPAGPENPAPKPSDPNPADAKWDELQKRLADATKQWDQNKYGPDAKKYLNEWRQALRDVAKFKDPDNPYWQTPFEPSEVPWPYGPRSSGPGPQGGGAAPPTGPGGTQIIPPSTSPTAPTLPGTGPGGTQVIPPSPTNTQPLINCAGTPCVSPYAKTQTGIGGALNALGQKGGG